MGDCRSGRMPIGRSRLLAYGRTVAAETAALESNGMPPHLCGSIGTTFDCWLIDEVSLRALAAL